jgi:hypothetical protein
MRVQAQALGGFNSVGRTRKIEDFPYRNFAKQKFRCEQRNLFFLVFGFYFGKLKE